MKGSGIYTVGYADGIFLLALWKFTNTVSGLIQWALHTVETMCDQLRVSVKPDKTGFVVFTRSSKGTWFL
jgi:hypothetical protein